MKKKEKICVNVEKSKMRLLVFFSWTPIGTYYLTVTSFLLSNNQINEIIYYYYTLNTYEACGHAFFYSTNPNTRNTPLIIVKPTDYPIEV